MNDSCPATISLLVVVTGQAHSLKLFDVGFKMCQQTIPILVQN